MKVNAYSFVLFSNPKAEPMVTLVNATMAAAMDSTICNQALVSA